MKELIFKVSSWLIVCTLIGFTSCSDEPSCTDGEQNQFETGIDCGGPCTDCDAVPTCVDGILNQGEEEIDCGGPCPSCDDDEEPIETGDGMITATINGEAWASVTVLGTEGFDSELMINGVGTDGSVLTLGYKGAFETGTYDLDLIISSSYTENAEDFCSSVNGSAGSITFTTFDTSNKLVSGSFGFSCAYEAGGEETDITAGQFTDVSYQ